MVDYTNNYTDFCNMYTSYHIKIKKQYIWADIHMLLQSAHQYKQLPIQVT